MIFGTDRYRYQVVEGWGHGPAGREFGGVVPAIATDSQDRVYITRRKPPTVLVYDREGRFLTDWGADIFKNPHGIWISPEDDVFVTDVADHTVRQLTTGGKVVRTWGTPDQTGAPGMPFNQPTWAVRTPDGTLFVSDGYGQFRVHRFAPDGSLVRSWGEQGQGPGQFALPHCLRVDRRGRVLVVDRENHRIQLFNAEGDFLEAWTNVEGPNDLFIDRDDTVYVAESPRRISIFNLDGKLLARWGEEGNSAGQFIDHPHGIWADSHGDLYIAEVPWLENRLQKFARV